MLTARARVAGEDAPALVPTSLLVAAVALAAVFVREVSATEAPDAPAVVELPVAPSAAPQAAPPAAPPAAAPAPTASASEALEPSCPLILVAFRSGEASPSPAVAQRLTALGAAVAAVPGASVVVDGHADSLGTEDLNLRLSKRRAEAVAWAIERGGVDHARIVSRGFGAFTPVEGAKADGEENRRAAIHVRGACPEGFKEVLGP